MRCCRYGVNTEEEGDGGLKNHLELQSGLDPIGVWTKDPAYRGGPWAPLEFGPSNKHPGADPGPHWSSNQRLSIRRRTLCHHDAPHRVPKRVHLASNINTTPQRRASIASCFRFIGRSDAFLAATLDRAVPDIVTTARRRKQ